MKFFDVVLMRTGMLGLLAVVRRLSVLETLRMGLQELLNAEFRTVMILTAPLLISGRVSLVLRRS